MPSLGSDMEAGTLVEWLKQPGDEVHRGDIIAVVETQKGAIEVEIFEDGVLDGLLVELGTEVPVGAPMAYVRSPGEAEAEKLEETAGEVGTSPLTLPTLAPGSPPSPQGEGISAAPEFTPLLGEREGPAAKPCEGEGVAPPSPAMDARRPTASPAARRLAAEKGVDLSTVSGSGPGGAIVTTDVLAGAKPAPPVSRKQRGKGLDFAEMRKAIASAMARSKREIPHYYLSTTIDLRAATDWLEAANAERPPTERILPPILLMKATALVLKKMPEFNGFHSDDRFMPSEHVHLGTAVAIRGGGLIAPAIHDADRLGLDALMAALRDLVARVRGGGLRSSEMTDPTVTVTSLGDRGVETVFGAIYPPQVAIIGFGKAVERPWVVDGQVVARPLVTATLSADHRVSDGHKGALMLNEIDNLLQAPEAL